VATEIALRRSRVEAELAAERNAILQRSRVESVLAAEAAARRTAFEASFDE
jgi:hypothetical protein